MSEIPTPFKILSAITAGTLVGCSVAEAISPIPTEQAKNITGTLELASTEIGDNFWSTQVIYGKLNPLDKEGLSKQDLTCLNIEINKTNFDFCTFESRDGAKENWWIKSPEGWIELQKVVKSGYNMENEIINLATWTLDQENVIWYPQNQDDWLKDSQNPNFGITFLPPSVFGENPIQGYDRSSGLGIKIPLVQVENDPFSQENIFQAIAYRTGFQIGGVTPTLVQPTETPTPSPESLLPQEVKERFEELGAELGEDENGNPIYYVTNPAGETVIVGKMNEEKNKWELGDSVKYTLSASKEEAQNNFFDYDFVMRGGPGEIAKLNAEPFPEDVITGLNVVVLIPDLKYKYYNYLYFDRNGENIIKKSPGKEPYRNMGWFSFVNEVGQQGYGTVWQWINPDKSIVYLTTVGFAGADPNLIHTPFVGFNFTMETPNFTTASIIGKDQKLNALIQQWADTDIIPVELQNHALLVYGTFNP